MAILVVCAGQAHAQVIDIPAVIPYQGHLTDAGGIDVSDGIQIDVRLYDSLIAGIGQGVTNSHVIYAESHPGVAVEKGNFRIGIGEGVSLDPKWTGLPLEGEGSLLEKENVYIELWVNGERLSPRQRMGSVLAVFFAEYAKYADQVDNLPAVTAASLPNYPAELITTGTLNEARIPNTLDVSLIDGALSKSMIPAALSADMFNQVGSLPVALIGAMDAGKIVNGTINKEMFASGSYIARDDFFVMSGSVSHGQALSIPAGFQESQCQQMLTPGVTMGSVEGIDQIYLSVTSGVVRCEVDKHEASDGTSKTAPCTANYMMVCNRSGS